MDGGVVVGSSRVMVWREKGSEKSDEGGKWLWVRWWVGVWSGVSNMIVGVSVMVNGGGGVGGLFVGSVRCG